MTGKLLITGASGFVGRALASRLECERRPVLGLCRQESAMEFPIATLPSLARSQELAQILMGTEVVIHCAARVHVMRDNAAEPLALFREVNRDMTLELARMAAQSGVRRFVFVSSIKVNGESTSGRTPFQPDEKANPEDPYAISKYEAEQGLMQIASETGMEVTIIRPPLVYGPGVKGNFASMVRLIKTGLPLPLGAIHNKRSLVALNNLVDLLVTCIDHPSAANEVFLVSDGDDLSTTELLRAVAGAMGTSPRLISVPYGLLMAGAAILGKRAVADRVLGSLQADISKTQKVLGWKPPMGVNESLQSVVPMTEGEG